MEKSEREEVQKQIKEQESQSESTPKMEIVDIDPNSLQEVESERKDLIDFEKYRLEKNRIAAVEIVRIPSKFAKAKDGKVHRLKLIGTVVETVEVDGNKYEFRPTELINLEELEDGTLKGLPMGEKSEWSKLKKQLGITEMKQLIGKGLPMRVNESSGGAKYLGYMY